MLFQGREGLASASWAWKKMLRYVVIVVAVVGFAALLWPSSAPQGTPLHAASNVTISADVKCDPDVHVLNKLHVTKLAAFTRREMVVDFSPDPVPMRQRVSQPLLDVKPENLEQLEVPEGQDGCSIPIPMAVQLPPKPKLADASHIDFGVATTASRLNESLDQFVHWAGYTRTRIFALIEPDKQDGELIRQVKAKADNLGINLYISVSEDNFLHRYFALIPLLEGNKREQTRWAGIIDDDTFFLSMPALVDALDAYNHTEPMYVGGVSEGVPQIAVFGMIAFGGAGIFLSMPLVAQLTAVYDECARMSFTGDRRLGNCIYQYTSTRLTVNHRLHQLDLMRDASGFFESGREPPLSVHHWKSWFKADMPKLSVVSDLCGDTCLLRQWQFSDGWFLTNGYSIVGDLTMEMTWEPHNGAVQESYLHELGPLRRKDEYKVSYLLEDSVLEPDGRVKQWYIERDKSGDKVVELTWRSR
ncbi:uncharacterized protein N7459_004090 [Penicillium hispanicum]|uniref:uncharacterized protein n=1 Tax=Penicillium hispanicum TaxID=1080232 RepID=UPI0025417EDB|nr:uncharacterized protein N7459_004090 [Penicillium hispanicum]KAJ5584290.1 hypothetical protein N7459_004090 [Penicillium hispanicum]